MPELRRDRDGAGDSGARIEQRNRDGDLHIPNGLDDIREGYNVLVGSIAARSYSYQDYWLTTEILEITERGDNYIKFKTLNSDYTLYDR